jgi:hypothetical protein
MGSLDVASYPPIVAALVPMGLVRRLRDAAARAGSHQHGPRIGRSPRRRRARVERLALVSASMATGAAVSLGGPILLLGIIVPHLVRLLVGADHRLVLPASALFGASFLIICDLIARTAFGAVELPVGSSPPSLSADLLMAPVPTRQIARRLLWLGALSGVLLAASGLIGHAAATRIVSIIPATTEMLFAMGAGDRVVAIGSFDHYPPEAERLPRVGALIDPNVERILTLRPDLVVVYGTQADLISQLDRAHIPFYSYTHRGLSDIATTIRALGARVGVDAGANALADRVERRLADIRARVAKSPRPRTLLVFGASRVRSGTSTPAEATASCTTCWKRPEARRPRRRPSSVGDDVDGNGADPAAGRDCRAPLRTGRRCLGRGHARVGRVVVSPGGQESQVFLLRGESSSCRARV